MSGRLHYWTGHIQAFIINATFAGKVGQNPQSQTTQTGLYRVLMLDTKEDELIMSYLVHKMSHLSSLLSLQSKQQNNKLLCFMFGAKKRMKKICGGLAVNNISIFSTSLFLGDEMLTINNFLFNAQIDNINLFKVKDENQSNHLFSPFQIKLQTSALIVTPLSLPVAEVL